jgi:glycosyltransferase involved in cell wall biosynthesis
VLRSAARVFTISDFNRRHLERTAGADVAPKLNVLHLGVRVDTLPRWLPASEVFTIASTASGLGDKKGLPVLIDACALLAARGVRFRCRICGSDPGGERLAALRRALRERGLDGRIELLGALPSRQSQLLVAGAGVFVHPSIRTAAGDMDGIPVSLIEAMGIGAPVIASRLSGIPELIDDGRSGLLVTPGDARGLADAIDRLAGQPALGRALGRQGRARVEDAFTIARSVDGLLDAWRGIPPSRRAEV